MQIKVDVTPSLNAVGRVVGNLELNQVLHKILTEVALTVERYSKQVTPVDTGRLRASIGTSFLVSGGLTRGGTARVAPHTDYAGWVHDGTRRMGARPFMRWGAEYAEQKMNGVEIASRIDKHVREKLSTIH